MENMMEVYRVGELHMELVKSDSNKSVYDNLNTVTNGNWTYEINSIMDCGAVVKVFIPGRVMVGVGYGETMKDKVNDAIDDAYGKLFLSDDQECNHEEIDAEKLREVLMEVKEEVVEEPTPIETPVVEDTIIEPPIDLANAVTFDEIPNEDAPQKFDEEKHIADMKAKEERDNATPIPGSDITQRQIDFMNEFKEYNKIDNDSKFDYYVKTWATHNSVDNINTKKELISAGKDILENFIVWIKNFQPVLDQGIVSPI